MTVKTIVCVIPTLMQGGAERVMSTLVNEFSKSHKVILVLLTNSELFYEVPKSVQVLQLGFVNKGGIYRVFSEFQTFFKLRKVLRKSHPDSVLSFMEKYNILTLLASAFLGLRVYVSDRSNPLRAIPTTLRILQKKTYPYAAGIIAQTSLATEVLYKLTSHKNIRLIPNPLRPVQTFPELQREKLIINVGRLVPEKGHQYLLESFSRLTDLEWTLVVLGDGPLRGALENQVKKLGIGERVMMPGSVKNVDEWLARSSIFAFSSVSEGFPNALIEAMAAGLPCVSFNCNSGPSDIIIDGKNGFLTRTGDIDLFCDRIMALIQSEDDRVRIGTKAKKTALEFDKMSISKQYLDFMLE